MPREILPHRRYSENASIVFKGTSYSVKIGFYDDGRPAETFCSMMRAAGTDADTNARDISVLMSLCIQHGVPLNVIARSTIKDENGNPDGIAGHLAQMLIDWEPIVSAPDQLEEKPEAPDSVSAARSQGFTGDQCSECQNFMMVRNGTCLNCKACGATTGCS